MDPETPTRRPQHATPQGTPLKTPVGRVLQQVEDQTPRSGDCPASIASPFASPALRRLDENSLRDRLREAYGLLKEKERNLFLAATLGQELVEANQQLQDDYQKLQQELADTRERLSRPGETPLSQSEHYSGDEQASRLHGRRRSMHLQQAAERRDGPHSEGNADDSNSDGEREKQWVRAHVQPIKAQLQLSQERADELLAEREDLGTQVYGLRQDLSAALRRAGESAAASADAQRRLEQAEEDKARLRDEVEQQRAFWAGRWSEHQRECQVSALAGEDAQRTAERHAEDAAARIRAQQRADNLHVRLTAAQAELELFRSQMQRMEDERVSEWEPMRGRWLASEEALQELQEAHQSTCEALAQAEARLAELDQGAELSDPIKLKSEKTSTSLLGELDLQRHTAVSQQRALAREHTALKRAYGRALHSQSRMKQQVARLTQLAATGANEARMKRLEAALGEAECQQQALLWANMDQRRPAGMDVDVGSGSSEVEGTALVTTLRARLKQLAADRDQAQRELRTAHLLRANEMQKTRDLEREAADTEAQLRRAVGELTSLRSECEILRRSAGSKRQRRPQRADDMSLDSHEEQLRDETDTLDHIPPRKRTGSKAGMNGSASPRRGGPMSLAFVINSDTKANGAANDVGDFDQLGAAESPATSSIGSAAATKRRRVAQSPDKSAADGIKAAVPEADDAAGVKVDLSEFNDAADRGLKSWLGTLAAAHAPAVPADTAAFATEAADNLPSTAAGSELTLGGGKHPETVDKSIAPPQQARKKDGVDEIYIGSRMAQKPIECNNQ
ncbi:hypothetical protein LPJ63_002191 [Coemansia sp. RSA 2711]|nr:hypothetical protein LPJ63_002191 [Coemansia sp. RSA 2711]